MKKLFAACCALILFNPLIIAQVKIGENPTQIIPNALLQINGTDVPADDDPNSLVFYGDFTDASGNGGFGPRLGIGTTEPNSTLDVKSNDTKRTAIALRNFHEWYLNSEGENADLASKGSFMIWDGTRSKNRLLISPAGNIGIGGVFFPRANLEIENDPPSVLNADNDRTTLSLNGHDATRWILNSEGSLSPRSGAFQIWDATKSKARMVIYPNGNMSIGGSLFSDGLNLNNGENMANLEISNGLDEISNNRDRTTLALNNVHRWILNSEGSSSPNPGSFLIWDATNSRAGLLIDQNNQVAIGTTDTEQGTALNVAGVIQATAIKGPSDKRFKKNINSLENSLEKVLSLKAYSYEWKVEEFPSKNFKKGKDIGLIAQEVEKVVPEVVYTADDSMKSKSIDYTKLVPLLIDAIKELKAEIEQLKSQLPYQKR